MKGYLSILIVLSIAGCTYLQPSNLGAVDACKLSSVDDTTFCKSINTADSIWINPLNKIVNSRIFERDLPLQVKLENIPHSSEYSLFTKLSTFFTVDSLLSM